MGIKKEIVKLVKNSGIFFIGAIGSKLILYILVPIYTAYLSTEEYGLADIFYTSIQILIPLLTIKISSAVFRFTVGKEKEPAQMLSNSIPIVAFASFVLLLGYWVLWFIFGLSINPLIFTLWFATIAINEIFAQFSKAINKNVVYVINSFICAFMLLSANCFFLIYARMGIAGYVYSLIIANFVSASFVFFFAKLWNYINLKHVSKDSLKTMLSYSWPLVPGALSFLIIQSSDKYMVLWLIGSSATGILSVAYKIPNLCGTMVNIFAQAWELSAIQNKNDATYYDYVFKRYTKIVLFCSSFLLLLSWPIATLLFKGDFIEAYIFVPLLVFGFMFCYFQTFFESIFVAIKDTKKIMISLIIGAAINLLLNYVFILAFSTIGVVYATGISYVVVFLIRYLLLRKKGLIKHLSLIDLLAIFLVLAQALFNTVVQKWAVLPNVAFFICLSFLICLEIVIHKRKGVKK